MEVIDQQYIRRFRQHIPFYKSNYPQEDRRVYWHEQRQNCDRDCIFGIPVVQGQYLLFVLEDDDPTAVQMNPFPGGNTVIELCCMDQDDDDDCPDLSLSTVQEQTFIENRQCIIDGQPKQFNYFRIQFPTNTNCGIHYLKVIAYQGTSNERIFYSQAIDIYKASDVSSRKLIKLNINDPCSVGGIRWVDVWQGWPFIDGHEVYLPEGVKASFVEEVTDEEVEEDGRGNELQVFEKVEIRYQFDTGFIPDHYMEIIKEITRTDDNSISIPDNQQTHYFKISRAQSEMIPDNEGCYMNVNMAFTIKTTSQGSCCPEDECECPQDNGNSAISYTTDQQDAEVNPDVGDTYLVPNNGAAGPNPDWKVHDNEIAVWNGNDWDYTNPPPGEYYFVEDQNDYFIKKDTNDIWVQGDAVITSIVEVGGGTCQVTIEGTIPFIAFAKAQISPAGAGTWTDLGTVGNNFFNHTDWLAGQTFSVSVADDYDFRLVLLDIGCNLADSDPFNFVTTENCV